MRASVHVNTSFDAAFSSTMSCLVDAVTLTRSAPQQSRARSLLGWKGLRRRSAERSLRWWASTRPEGFQTLLDPLYRLQEVSGWITHPSGLHIHRDAIPPHGSARTSAKSGLAKAIRKKRDRRARSCGRAPPQPRGRLECRRRGASSPEAAQAPLRGATSPSTYGTTQRQGTGRGAGARERKEE